MHGNVPVAQGHIAGLQLAQVHTSNDFAMYHQQQAVAGQKFGQIRIVVLPGNNFVHRVADSFQSLQFLDLADHRGLVHVNQNAAVFHHAHQAQKSNPCGEPHRDPHQREGDQGATQNPRKET